MKVLIWMRLFFGSMYRFVELPQVCCLHYNTDKTTAEKYLVMNKSQEKYHNGKLKFYPSPPSYQACLNKENA